MQKFGKGDERDFKGEKGCRGIMRRKDDQQTAHGGGKEKGWEKKGGGVAEFMCMHAWELHYDLPYCINTNKQLPNPFTKSSLPTVSPTNFASPNTTL